MYSKSAAASGMPWCQSPRPMPILMLPIRCLQMLAYTGHREICPQIVALSVTAGKYAALFLHRVHHHLISAMFYCQFVYNMQENMRLCAWKEARQTPVHTHTVSVGAC